MTPDAATTNTPGAAAPRSSNAEVIDTILSHHSDLAAQLHERTSAVLSAAKCGQCSADRDALIEWYRAELMPHIVAEERALYSAAQELDTTRLLVRGMQSEHHLLVSLIADLALGREDFETALAAASAQTLFAAHLGKENDLLLPALDAAGLDLAALLDGMHEILGGSDSSADVGCGCGCGCGHDASEDADAPVPADFTAAQIDEPPAGLRTADDELDVRTLPHGQRHEIIFAKLAALAAGQALVIVNDHDPKPLRYQTEALWPDRFEWTYRHAGPQIWRVAITRAA